MTVSVMRKTWIVVVAFALAAAAMILIAARSAHEAGAAGSTSRASVFVSNVDDDTVSVIDPVTQTEIATIPVGDEPRNLAPNPDGSRVYVPNRFDDSVTVIDTVTNTVVTTVTDSSFDEPYSLAVTPDGSRIYVSNKQGGDSDTGSVTIIDAATNTVTGSIDDACFSSPEGTAADPVRARIYVVNRNTNNPPTNDRYQVCIVDTTSNTVTGAITVGSQPRYAVVTADGASLYTANNTSGDVSKVRLSDNNVTPIATGGSPRNMTLSNDGTKVYVALQSGSIAAISVATDAVTAITFTGMSGSYGVAVVPGTNLGYVTDENSDEVAVFDTSTDVEITGAGFPITGTFDTPRAIAAVGDPAVPPPVPPPVVITPAFTG